MRLSPCWMPIFLLQRPTALLAPSWGSLYHSKAMKVLLLGGCDRNFHHGYRVNYPRGGETHSRKIAGHREVRWFGNVWELRHVHLDLLQVRSLVVCSSKSSSYSLTENRVTTVPNYASKFDGLQQVGSWTQRAGCLCSNPSRDYFNATAVECGRSSGRKISAVESAVTQDELTDDELEDEIADGDDEDFWEDDAYPKDPEVGDGEDGGGTVLDEAEWGKTALTLASETLDKNFGSEFSLFAFKLSKDAGLIRVRLDKLTDKYGSPTMDDIEKFSTIYGKVLEEEGLAKRLPDNLALEVSSPGAERVVRVPQDLERFRELPMYVRYTVNGETEESVKDGIWQVDRVEGDKAVWRLANVRANREIAGKGRPLNKKQKEWRLEVAFCDTQLVRLYLDV